MTELAPVPVRAELKNSKASNSIDIIIPKNKNKSQGEDFVGGATELAPVPPRAELKNSKASNSIDKSIPKNKNKSQEKNNTK